MDLFTLDLDSEAVLAKEEVVVRQGHTRHLLVLPA